MLSQLAVTVTLRLMRLVLKSRGSTSHHCSSFQVPAFVVQLPSKVAKNGMTPIPNCPEDNPPDEGRGYPCDHLEASQFSDTQAYRGSGPRSRATYSVKAVL